MQVSNSSFDKFDQDKCLNNRIARGTDAEATVVSLVKDAECIS